MQLLLEHGRTCFESIQPFSLGYSKLDRECTGCGGILLVKRGIPLAIEASSRFFEPGIPNEEIDLIYLRVSLKPRASLKNCPRKVTYTVCV